MSLPAFLSWAQVYLVGIVALFANALLLSVNPGGGGVVPPANFSRTMTLSMTLGEPPVLSWLVFDSHRPPSGVVTTSRSRPHLPLKKARGVSVPVPAVLMCMTHSREPRTAAMYSQSLTISRPLGEADATSQVRIGLVYLELLHGPSQSGQPLFLPGLMRLSS